MKFWTAVLAILFAVSLVGVAEAKGGGAKANKAGKTGTKAKADVLKGKVVSVAADGQSLVVKQKKTKAQVTVAVGPKTKVKGAATSVSQITAGERVKVRPATGTAKVIKVKAAKVKGAKKAAGKKTKKGKK
jgi:hypothetical protein